MAIATQSAALAKERYLAKQALARETHTPEFLASTFKACSKCDISKPLDAFGACPNGPLGRSSQCSGCRHDGYIARRDADPEKMRASGREASRKNRATRTVYRRKSYTRARFGMEPEQVDSFVRAYLSKSGPHCFSCGVECEVVGGVKKAGARRLVLDHDHKTGALRSMICDLCNTALGKLGDNSEGVRKLLAYISKYEESSH